MKNFQVIDGARNATFSIYSIEESLFKLIFHDNQEIDFDEDIMNKLTKKQKKEIFPMVWHNEVEKIEVNGIHGTVYYGDEFLRLKETYINKSHGNSLLQNFNKAGKNKKVIQIVENKLDLILSTYEVTSELFDKIFLSGQDMEYEQDLEIRLGQSEMNSIMTQVIKKPVNKATIKGIDGTFYYGDDYFKFLKRDFPSKKYKRHQHTII